MFCQCTVLLNFLEAVTGNDTQRVSSPSTVFCCIAVYNSENAMGVGLAPIAFQAARWMEFSMVLSFQALQVCHSITGVLLVVTLRKPFSHCQAFQTEPIEAFQDLLSGFSAESHIVYFLFAQEHVVHIIQIQVMVACCHRRSGTDRDIALTVLGHLESLLIVAELVIGKSAMVIVPLEYSFTFSPSR